MTDALLAPVEIERRGRARGSINDGKTEGGSDRTEVQGGRDNHVGSFSADFLSRHSSILSLFDDDNDKQQQTRIATGTIIPAERERELGFRHRKSIGQVTSVC